MMRIRDISFFYFFFILFVAMSASSKAKPTKDETVGQVTGTDICFFEAKDVCKQKIGKDAIKQCRKAYKKNQRKQCKNVVTRSQSKRIIQKAKKYCRSEISALCSKETAENEIQCLLKNKKRLSRSCKSSFSLFSEKRKR